MIDAEDSKMLSTCASKRWDSKKIECHVAPALTGFNRARLSGAAS
jgi:hypothetical protein